MSFGCKKGTLLDRDQNITCNGPFLTVITFQQFILMEKLVFEVQRRELFEILELLL